MSRFADDETLVQIQGLNIQVAAYKAYSETLLAALKELVALKDIKDRFDLLKQDVDTFADAAVLAGIAADYQARKPAAWQTAKALVAASSVDSKTVQAGGQHGVLTFNSLEDPGMSQPTAVGYRGQRFEVSVFDDAANGRRVVAWTNDPADASRLATGFGQRPGWSCSWVTDLTTDISHTLNENWIGERPMPTDGGK